MSRITKYCSTHNCHSQVYGRGWCSLHYQRWAKYGDPTITKLPRHGGDGTPEYQTWVDMKRRCDDPKRPGYKNYGGRGIIVCERWYDFRNFYADMGERPEGMSLDRVDNNGHYEPGNCRWATAKEQANNRRNSHNITYAGFTYTLAEWGKLLDIPESTIRNRLNRQWSIEDTLETI